MIGFLKNRVSEYHEMVHSLKSGIPQLSMCIEVRDLEMSESGNLSLSADHFKEDNLQMFPLYLLVL